MSVTSIAARLGAIPRARGLLAPCAFAALAAIAGQVRIPIPGNPVPLTLQTVVVLLAGAALTPSAAATSMILFVAAGLFGLPVFAGGGAGFAHLLGPTGGYLLGFVAGAAVCSALLKGRTGSLGRTVLAMTCGMGVIHACGVAHLAIYLGGDPTAALAFARPFLPIDVLKIVMAAAVASGASALLARDRGEPRA